MHFSFVQHTNRICLLSSDERVFRLHTKRMVEKFTNSVIDAAQRELTVETATKIKSMSDNVLHLIKPETIKFLSKLNAHIDKHFSIPDNLPLGENSLQNTPDMDDYETQCKKEIAEMELVYKQQAIMIMHLKSELQLYLEAKMDNEAHVDLGMCEVFERINGETNLNDELIDNAVKMMKEVGIEITINSNRV